MQTKHLSVLIHIWTTGEVGAVKPILALKFYGLFKGGTSFVDHLYLLCHVFLMLSRLFIAALWSPAGKGLTLGSCRWYLLFLIVLFSDSSLLSYFVSLAGVFKKAKKGKKNNKKNTTKINQAVWSGYASFHTTNQTISKFDQDIPQSHTAYSNKT